MKTSDFHNWLLKFFKKHPVASVPQPTQNSYTEEVMSKIKTLENPKPAWVWFRPPRLALSLGGAIAVVLLVVVLAQNSTSRINHQIEEDWQLLFEVGETADLQEDSLEESVRDSDRIFLAETIAQDAETAWVEEMLQLLDELDEPITSPSEESLTDEEWLELFETLDEEELALS